MKLRSEGYKKIFKWGIAFYKKDCLIKIKIKNSFRVNVYVIKH